MAGRRTTGRSTNLDAPLTSLTTGIAATMNAWAAKMEQLKIEAEQAMTEGVQITADAIKQEAARKTPRRSGSAAGHWGVVWLGSKGNFPARVGVVNTAPHWPYIRTGTGEYGPSGRKIRPKGKYKSAPGTLVEYVDKSTGEVLSFVKEGESKFSAWSRGMEPRDPMGMVSVSSAISTGRVYVRDKLGRFMSNKPR